MLLPLATIGMPFGGATVPPGAAVEPVVTAPTVAEVRDAAGFAASRDARVSWAVIDSRGTLRGRHVDRPHRSASLSKAMLLVAYLRARGARGIPAAERALLEPMILISANRKATAIRAIVGEDGLQRVARAAGMTRFTTNGTWSELELTPADQARLFLRIDRLVPRRHRPYARRLLETITPKQAWGIAAVARRRGFTVHFKGGWREGLANQAALLERDGRRMAVVVMTDGLPDVRYGVRTIAGVAARLLGPPS